jgi:hypothetical protein
MPENWIDSLEEPVQHFDIRIGLYVGKVRFGSQVIEVLKYNVDRVRTQVRIPDEDRYQK